MFIETRKHDIRCMNLEEISSSSENQETREALIEFTDNFLFRLGNLTISAICGLRGLDLESIEDLSELTDAIRYSYIASLLRNDYLSNQAVYGHYVKKGTHYFPFALNCVEYRDYDDRSIGLYTCIYSSNNGFGIAEFWIDKGFTFLDDDSIFTLQDVYQYLSNRYDFGRIPFYVQ